MIIKRLRIRGFGKFKNTSVELSNGLNVVYGDNEAGKSTLQKFIEGMFFGFHKPYKKNKIFLPEEERYKPWDGGYYGGRIDYLAEGRAYSLLRNLDPQNESVRLYDAISQSEITDTLEFDPASKLPMANKHININSTMFRNTVSISQSESSTDDALAGEIGELLVNTTSTMSSDVSLKSAYDYLAREKDKIGTVKQTKSPLGAAQIKLNELNEMRTISEECSKSCREIYLDLDNTMAEFNELKGRKSYLMDQSRQGKLYKALEKCTRINALEVENESIREQIADIPDIDEDQLSEYTRIDALIDAQYDERDELLFEKRKEEEKLKALRESRGKSITDNPSEGNISDEEVFKDTIVLENTINKLAQLKEFDDKSNELKQSFAAYSKYNKSARVFSVSGTVVLFLAVACAILGYLFTKTFYYIGGMMVALSLIFFILWSDHTKKKNLAEKDYEKFDTITSRTLNEEILYQLEIDRLVKKYSVDDEDELKDVLINSDNYVYGVSARSNISIEQCERRIKELEKQIGEADTRIEALEGQIATILADSDCTSEDELRLKIEQTRKKELLRANIENNENRIKDIIGNDDPEELRTQALDAINSGMNISTPADIVKEDEDIDQIDIRINELISELASLNAQLSQLENNAAPLNEVEEQIEYYTNLIEGYKSRLKAIEMAEETLNDISSSIQQDFSEEFNEYVSEIAAIITEGRYCDVHVNEKMEISITDNDTGMIIPVSSLSSGTIDQLYLAVRLTIADLVIKDKTIPLILDDCFLQYDADRLRNTLRFIGSISNRRQVILFTCRDNEYKTLKEEKIEVRKRKTRTKTKRSNNDKTEDVKVKNKSTQQPEELQKNEAKPKSEQVIKQKKSKYTNKQIFEISQKLFLEFCQNDISEERKSEIKQEFYSLFEEIDEDNKVKIRAKLYKFINSKDNRHNKKMKKALVEISQRNNDIDLDL